MDSFLGLWLIFSALVFVVRCAAREALPLTRYPNPSPSETSSSDRPGRRELPLGYLLVHGSSLSRIYVLWIDLSHQLFAAAKK